MKRTTWESREQQARDAQEALVQNWNDTREEGLVVEVRRDGGGLQLTRTRSIAWLASGVAVILLEDISGCYRLDRVSVPKEKQVANAR